MTVTYIEAHAATVEDLKPGTRLYILGLYNTCVARIGSASDWAAYWGASYWELDWVADHGLKMSEDYAKQVFPICKEAGLSYRL